MSKELVVFKYKITTTASIIHEIIVTYAYFIIIIQQQLNTPAKFTNGVDSGKAAHYELPHQNLGCLSFSL